ncbi:MAG: DUF58 domain-containing protein, partial [Candidatus Riflebacteria bacterium]|nr:DUF58 domain-containing protein [Candidatus Riflebacteria bacterium]
DRSNLGLDPRILREEYRVRVRGFLDRLAQECSFHKIDYQLFKTTDPLELALSRYLLRRTRF